MKTYKSPVWDEHERNSGTLDTLVKLDLPHEVDTLPIGDVLVSDYCAIEIKRILKRNPQHPSGGNDVWESMKDGRLYEQAYQRMKQYSRSILIIEIHDRKNITNKYFSQEMFEEMETTMELKYNTHVYHTYSQSETIELVYKIYNRYAEMKHHPPTHKSKIPYTLYERQIRLLSGLLDCGEVKATDMLDEFKTPAACFLFIINHGPEKIGGIGPKFFDKNELLLLGIDANGKHKFKTENYF